MPCPIPRLLATLDACLLAFLGIDELSRHSLAPTNPGFSSSVVFLGALLLLLAVAGVAGAVEAAKPLGRVLLLSVAGASSLLFVAALAFGLTGISLGIVAVWVLAVLMFAVLVQPALGKRPGGKARGNHL